MTGQYELVPDMPVPGANAGHYDGDADANGEITEAAENFQAAQGEAVQKEQTEAQANEEKQRTLQSKAQRANLDVERAQLDAADAEAKAGVRPEPEELLPDVNVPSEEMVFTEDQVEPFGESEMVFSEDQVEPIVQPPDISPPIAGSFEVGADEEMKGALAAKAGVDIGRSEDLLESVKAGAVAAENLRTEHKQYADEKRAEHQGKLDAVSEKADAVFKSKPKMPTPSILNLVGVFLGGLVAPSQGGRNTAAEILTRRLEKEVDVAMESRRTDLSTVRTERGLVQDAATKADQEILERAGLMGQSIEGLAQHITAQAELPWVAPTVKTQLGEAVGQLRQHQGKLLDQFVNVEKDRLTRTSELEMKYASQKRGRGGRGKPMDVQPTKNQLAENRLYGWHGRAVDPNDKTTWPEGVTFEDIGKYSVGGITITDGDESYSGLFAANADDAKEARTRLSKYNEVRQAAGYLGAELENLRKAQGVSTLSGIRIADLGSKQSAKVSRAFNTYRVALKELWGLGAIQKPDERLMDAETGSDPTGIKGNIANMLDLGVTEDLLGHTVASSEEAFKVKLRPLLFSGGEPDSGVEIHIGKPEVGKVPRAAGEGVKAESAEVIAGQLNALVELSNEEHGIPASLAAEAPEFDMAEAQERIDRMVEVNLASRGAESKKAKHGGITGTGKEKFQFAALAKTTQNPELKKALLAAEKTLSGAAKRATLQKLEKARQNKHLETVPSKGFGY